MNKKRISTALYIITAVTFLLVLAFKVKIGATADSIAVLKTTGMTCGSCTSKISEVLGELEGVAVTEVDVEGGWVVVGYDTKVLAPWILAEKVSGVGFNSRVHEVLTPEQFKQITGKDIGVKTAQTSVGCGGCGTTKQY